MEKWQAFVPGRYEEWPGNGTGRDDSEERRRTLSLIDFLADYDARRNPPVHDIGKYGIYLLRDADVPSVPGVALSPAAAAWLTVDFLDLPPRPEVPEELVALLGDSTTIGPHVRPTVRSAFGRTELGEPEADPDPELIASHQQRAGCVNSGNGSPQPLRSGRPAFSRIRPHPAIQRNSPQRGSGASWIRG